MTKGFAGSIEYTTEATLQEATANQEDEVARLRAENTKLRETLDQVSSALEQVNVLEPIFDVMVAEIRNMRRELGLEPNAI